MRHTWVVVFISVATAGGHENEAAHLRRLSTGPCGIVRPAAAVFVNAYVTGGAALVVGAATFGNFTRLLCAARNSVVTAAGIALFIPSASVLARLAHCVGTALARGRIFDASLSSAGPVAAGAGAIVATVVGGLCLAVFAARFCGNLAVNFGAFPVAV